VPPILIEGIEIFAVNIILADEFPIAIADVLTAYVGADIPTEFIITLPTITLFAVNVLFDSIVFTFNSDIV
jgi:hypothetical protein